MSFNKKSISMQSTAQHNLEEFVQYLRAPVWRSDNLIEWQEDAYHFVTEWRDPYLLLCIMLSRPSGDTSALLEVLYGRASPQRFMGLPIRVYQDKTSIIGALAIPEHAITARRLTQLQESLRRMFDIETL